MLFQLFILVEIFPELNLLAVLYNALTSRAEEKLIIRRVMYPYLMAHDIKLAILTILYKNGAFHWPNTNHTLIIIFYINAVETRLKLYFRVLIVNYLINGLHFALSLYYLFFKQVLYSFDSIGYISFLLFLLFFCFLVFWVLLLTLFGGVSLLEDELLSRLGRLL